MPFSFFLVALVFRSLEHSRSASDFDVWRVWWTLLSNHYATGWSMEREDTTHRRRRKETIELCGWVSFCFSLVTGKLRSNREKKEKQTFDLTFESTFTTDDGKQFPARDVPLGSCIKPCWNLKLYHDKRHESSIYLFLFSSFSVSWICRAGNVAWAHLCTKNKLKVDAKNISGLPIFITDDTPVTDAVRFTQRVNVDMEVCKIKPTTWAVPFLLCYMLAMLLEMVLRVVNVFTKLHVKYCPRGMLAFGSSLVLYDRLRSAISLEYEPIYTVDECFTRSGKWYDLWYQRFKDEKLSLRAKSSWANSVRAWATPRQRAEVNPKQWKNGSEKKRAKENNFYITLRLRYKL